MASVHFALHISLHPIKDWSWNKLLVHWRKVRAACWTNMKDKGGANIFWKISLLMCHDMSSFFVSNFSYSYFLECPRDACFSHLTEVVDTSYIVVSAHTRTYWTLTYSRMFSFKFDHCRRIYTKWDPFRRKKPKFCFAIVSFSFFFLFVLQSIWFRRWGKLSVGKQMLLFFYAKQF